MAIGRGFRQLADLIDSIEATDVEITDVSVPDEKPDGALLADLRLQVPLDGEDNGSTAEAADTTDTVGTVSAHIDAVDRDGTDEPGETDGADGSDGDSEQVVCHAEGCDEVFDTEHGMKIHHTKAHGLSAAGEPPVYRDPDALREVYTEHASFTEMTEALGVDVAPQTVRRNMIKHGIHDPEPTETDGVAAETDRKSDEGDASAPPASNVTLPAGTTLDDVKAAVASADTLYEVQQALDLDREQATDLLGELGLLELVHGRVATKHRRDDLKDEIDDRLTNIATTDR